MAAAGIIPKLEKFEYADERIKDEHDDHRPSITANIGVEKHKKVTLVTI